MKAPFLVISPEFVSASRLILHNFVVSFFVVLFSTVQVSQVPNVRVLQIKKCLHMIVFSKSEVVLPLVESEKSNELEHPC